MSSELFKRLHTAYIKDFDDLFVYQIYSGQPLIEKEKLGLFVDNYSEYFKERGLYSLALMKSCESVDLSSDKMHILYGLAHQLYLHSKNQLENMNS